MYHIANDPVTQARNLELWLILTDSHKGHLHDIHTHTRPKHTHTSHTHAFSLTHVCTHVCCIHMLHSCTHMCTHMLSLLHTPTHVHTCMHIHIHVNPICKGQVLSILPLYPPHSPTLLPWPLSWDPHHCLPGYWENFLTVLPSSFKPKLHIKARGISLKWKSSIDLPFCTFPHLLLSVE